MSPRPLFRRPLVPALFALGLTALAFAAMASPTPMPRSGNTVPRDAAQKPVLTTLHRFDSKYGAFSASAPTLGFDGSFYGVTAGGGLGVTNAFFGYGTIYKFASPNQFTTLYRFTNGADGRYPLGPLALGKDGNLYGTTAYGGSNNAGTVFRISPSGQFTVVHQFAYETGCDPGAGLLTAPDGSFYGTTTSSPQGGTVFHLLPDGTFTTLHTFNFDTEGGFAQSALAFGSDGALYGSLLDGGNFGRAFGSVFRVTTAGACSVLHTFAEREGGRPEGTLAVGTDGALYGTTIQGGGAGSGTVFRVTPSGRFNLLHSFSGDGHGEQPLAGLIAGADGLFYGTTADGGTDNQGTLFVMTPVGQVTTLYKFHTAFDGENPHGGVVFGPNGALYGTTSQGGAKGYGTIYRLTLPQ